MDYAGTETLCAQRIVGSIFGIKEESVRTRSATETRDCAVTRGRGAARKGSAANAPILISASASVNGKRNSPGFVKLIVEYDTVSKV